MGNPQFFGYGSLVNRATHDYPCAQPAQVQGWRRVWTHTKLRKLAYLSVYPVADARIDGLIAAVPGHDWAALDARERAYDRHLVTQHNAAADQVHIYAVTPAHTDAPDARHPILLSYVDVVVQGFLREFGEDGAQRFFETTDGWDTAILNDRDDPIYPRHQSLSATETAFVDAQLARFHALPLLER